MDHSPLVSVICLCYNHEKYVEESIRSVLDQSYKNIEIIVVDDASTDNSKLVIRKILKDHSVIRFIDLDQNLGTCRAFNHGFKASQGAFIIDLATDDLLMPNRVEEGIRAFGNGGGDYGVHFSDAVIIDEEGGRLKKHYHHDEEGKLKVPVPEGDVYCELLHRYFILSPTMMIRRQVLEEMGGYDESLAYEDFDFWVRSSRNYKYCFTDQALMKKRILKGSLSSKQYRFRSLQMESTYKVCKKAYQLNRDRHERRALQKRIRYELKWALATLQFALALKYLRLLVKNIEVSK